MSNRTDGKPVTTLYGVSWLLILIVLAVVALVTKPDMESFERHLREQLKVEVAENLRDNRSDTALSAIMKVGCSLDVEACVKLVRKQLAVQQTDLFVAQLVEVTGQESGEHCLGIFKNWFCTGFRQK